MADEATFDKAEWIRIVERLVEESGAFTAPQQIDYRSVAAKARKLLAALKSLPG
jgi:hypothetical protein